MGWIEVGCTDSAECDRCGAQNLSPITNVIPDDQRQREREEFCVQFGWAVRQGRFLCLGCLSDTLPEFPAWAVEGQWVRLPGPILGQQEAVGRVVSAQEHQGSVGQTERIITIRGAKGLGFTVEVWLSKGSHEHWEPIDDPRPKPPTIWDRLG